MIFGASATAGYMAYRTDLNFRQAVRVLMYDFSFWSSSRGLLLIGDSRIWSLRCSEELAGWRVLNLGNPGMTAQMLNDNLRNWLGRSVEFERTAVWIGVNDIIHRGRRPSLVATEISRIVGQLTSRSSRTAVFGQIPLLGEDDRAAIVNRVLGELQQDLEARLFAFGNVVDVLSLWPMDSTTIPRGTYSDSIHLSAEGNRHVCRQLGRWLAKS